jgi:agmatinase/guanidinopropionase
MSPSDPLPPPPFSGIATFGRVPWRTDFTATDVVLQGVPYDSATSNRSGARFGPRALREQSLLLWGYNNVQQVAPFAALAIVDGGDVPVVPPDVVATQQSIERETRRIVEAGALPITLGGDHSITLPVLRAVAAKVGPVAVIHFDAHPDTWDHEYPGQKYSHGTPFIRAIEEGLIDREAYVQLGIRGPTGGPQDYQDALRLGARMITLEEFRSRTMTDVIREVRERLGPRPVYVTFDIDAVDPAFAPGTGTPEVGGLTSHEALQLVRGLRGLTFAGFDLVEVAPPYDPTAITAILGANLVFEFLSLVAAAKVAGSA